MSVTSPVELEVPAADQATPFMDVQSGDVWSFNAKGSWRDWSISSGPEGYRNFIADILQIYPRCADQCWFCLCGMVEGTGEQFAIGRGCTHRFRTSGKLVLFANDLLSRYGNNHGSVTVTAAPGGSTRAWPIWIRRHSKSYGSWWLIRRTFEMTRGVATLAILVLGACLVLATLQQGRDLIRSIGDNSLDAPKQQLFAFVLGLLFLGIQSWLWPRMVVDFNYGGDRSNWRPRPLLEWGPRFLGIAPVILVLIALLLNPLSSGACRGAVPGLSDQAPGLDRRLTGAPGHQTGFGRWSVILCLLFAPLLMAVASLAPVAFGHALGSPAVVFLGLGLIIPPMVIAIQTGGGLRLPVIGSALLAAALFSLWMDNPLSATARSDADPARSMSLHVPRSPRPMRSGEPVSPIRRAATPVRAGRVARRRFAGRDWTTEVLGALHARSGGRLASASSQSVRSREEAWERSVTAPFCT